MAKRNNKTKYKHLDLTPYMGKWVAILDEKVIYCDITLEQLRHKITKRKLKKLPSIMLVPREDEGPYILVI